MRCVLIEATIHCSDPEVTGSRSFCFVCPLHFEISLTENYGYLEVQRSTVQATDFDLHGYVDIPLPNVRQCDVAALGRQLDPIQTPLVVGQRGPDDNSPD
jgi:hypothetical protein